MAGKTELQEYSRGCLYGLNGKLLNRSQGIEVLFKAEGGAASVITPLAAISMLVFCLLYTPCVAAIAAIRRELGRKWAAAIVVWQCALAWIFAYLVYMVGGMFIR